VCVDNGYNFCVKDGDNLAQVCCADATCAQAKDSSYSCTSSFKDFAQAKNAICVEKLAQTKTAAKVAHSETLGCNVCVDNGFNFCTKKDDFAQICCSDASCAQAKDNSWSCSSSFTDLAQAKNAVCVNQLAQTKSKVAHSEGLSCNTCVDNGYNFCTKDFAQICCLDASCAQAKDNTWSCSNGFTDLAQAK